LSIVQKTITHKNSFAFLRSLASAPVQTLGCRAPHCLSLRGKLARISCTQILSARFMGTHRRCPAGISLAPKPVTAQAVCQCPPLLSDSFTLSSVLSHSPYPAALHKILTLLRRFNTCTIVFDLPLPTTVLNQRASARRRQSLHQSNLHSMQTAKRPLLFILQTTIAGARLPPPPAGPQSHIRPRVSKPKTG